MTKRVPHSLISEFFNCLYQHEATLHEAALHEAVPYIQVLTYDHYILWVVKLQYHVWVE